MRAHYAEDVSAPIDLLLSGNGAWSPHLATTLLSAIRATTSTPIRIHIAAVEIGASDRTRIQEAAPGNTITWYEIPIEHLDALPPRRASKFNFIELLGVDRLPEDLHRVITLDADVMVRTDLGALWDTDLDGHVLAAARCAWGLWIARGIENWETLGLEGNRKYLQSGVKVVDLSAWRRERIHERSFAHLDRWHDTMTLGDQEMLNAVIDDDWVELPLRWNATTNPHIDEQLAACAISPKDLHDAEHDPAIVHYAGAKPWNWARANREELPWLEEWEQLAFSGPYRDWYLKERERGLDERSRIRPQRRSPLRRLRKGLDALLHG